MPRHLSAARSRRYGPEHRDEAVKKHEVSDLVKQQLAYDHDMFSILGNKYTPAPRVRASLAPVLAAPRLEQRSAPFVRGGTGLWNEFKPDRGTPKTDFIARNRVRAKLGRSAQRVSAGSTGSGALGRTRGTSKSTLGLPRREDMQEAAAGLVDPKLMPGFLKWFEAHAGAGGASVAAQDLQAGAGLRRQEDVGAPARAARGKPAQGLTHRCHERFDPRSQRGPPAAPAHREPGGRGAPAPHYRSAPQQTGPARARSVPRWS